MYGTDASFLRNDRLLPLGCRQNGSPVGDVELPEWASGSADEFLRVMRAALESEYVSSNLHSWIDLIFGVNQQSIEKDNVFRAPTECAPAGGSSAEDVAERAKHMLEVEEFGTCPRQIFFEQHPPRKTKGGEGGEGGERSFAGLGLDVRAVVRGLWASSLNEFRFFRSSCDDNDTRYTLLRRHKHISSYHASISALERGSRPPGGTWRGDLFVSLGITCLPLGTPSVGPRTHSMAPTELYHHVARRTEERRDV